MEHIVDSCERSELSSYMANRLVNESGYHYALTISDNQKGLETTISDLEFAASAIPQYCDIIGIKGVALRVHAFEAKGRTKHLHLHAYLTSPKRLTYKQLRVAGQQNYYRMLVGHRNRHRWLDYMAKSTRERAEGEWLERVFTHPDAPNYFI